MEDPRTVENPPKLLKTRSGAGGHRAQIIGVKR
jgi:hypothetical protein